MTRSPDDLPPCTLTENARTVLGLRYLKKDRHGNPTEAPETMFWRVARTVADVEADYGATEEAVDEVARGFYRLMSTGPLRAEFAYADERGPPSWATLGMFCPSRRGCPFDRRERHLRYPDVHGLGSSIWRRHGILVLPPASRG